MQKRISYFDFLNVFSCFSVVALHCNGIYHTYSHTSQWLYSAIIQVFFYFAVPIFFMLSGATLLEYSNRYSTSDFYKKRVVKTVIPYSFFGIVFNCLFVLKMYLKNDMTKINVRDIVFSFFTGDIPFTNYWFFIPLFTIYLFLPVFSNFVIPCSKKILEFLIFVLMIFESICPILENFFSFPQIQRPICGYILFVLLGYLLHKYNYEEKKSDIVILFIISFVLVCLRLSLIIKYSYSRIELLQSYFGLYSIIPASFIFLIAKKLLQQNTEYRILRFLSSLSFGVYLIQGFVIECFLSILKDHTWIMQIAGPIIVYLVCLLVVYIVRKIKFFRWIFP